MNKVIELDEIDRNIINRLQSGFPVSSRPYLDVASQLDISEDELISRLEQLLHLGVLSRFGPLYQVENMGGSFTLAAMKVEEECFDQVADIVNSLEQIAHNYQRDHEFNMWFVIATETPEEIQQVINKIETMSGRKVYNMPKQQEFFIQLKLAV